MKYILFEHFWPKKSFFVQLVQNIYGKGGYGVFKAEFRAAEVDPCFKIFHDQIAVLQKNRYGHNFQN